MQLLEGPTPTNDPNGKLYILSLMGLEYDVVNNIDVQYRVRIDLLDGESFTTTNIGVFNEFEEKSYVPIPHAEWNYIELANGDTHFMYNILDDKNS